MVLALNLVMSNSVGASARSVKGAPKTEAAPKRTEERTAKDFILTWLVLVMIYITCGVSEQVYLRVSVRVMLLLLV